MNKVLITGGPGLISRGTIAFLLERGDTVAVFTHHTASKQARYPDVVFYEGERQDPAALGRAIADFQPDGIVDFICFNLEEAQALYNATQGRVGHVVFISTVDTYGYPLSRLPFRESDAFRPPIGEYAAKKRQIEAFYQEKHASEGYPATIGRPSLSIGPAFCPMMFIEWGLETVPRMMENRPILVPGDGLGLMHAGWSYDVGRMAGRIVCDPVSVGRDYTLSAPDCLTRDDYISLFTGFLGASPERVYVPQNYIDRYPGVANRMRIAHLYRHNMAFSLDRFRADFPDYEWLPLARGVEEFITVNQQQGNFAKAPVEIIEDRIIADWKARLAGWGKSEGEGEA